MTAVPAKDVRSCSKEASDILQVADDTDPWAEFREQIAPWLQAETSRALKRMEDSVVRVNELTDLLNVERRSRVDDARGIESRLGALSAEVDALRGLVTERFPSTSPPDSAGGQASPKKGIRGGDEAKLVAIQVSVLGAQLRNDIQSQLDDAMSELRTCVSEKCADMHQKLCTQIATAEVNLRDMACAGRSPSEKISDGSTGSTNSPKALQQELLVSATMLGQLGDVLSLGQNFLSEVSSTSQEPMEPVGKLAAAWKDIKSQLEFRLKELEVHPKIELSEVAPSFSSLPTLAPTSLRHTEADKSSADLDDDLVPELRPIPAVPIQSAAPILATALTDAESALWHSAPTRAPNMMQQEKPPIARMTSAPASSQSREHIGGQIFLSGRASLDGANANLQVQRTLNAISCRGSSLTTTAEEPQPQSQQPMLAPKRHPTKPLPQGPGRLAAGASLSVAPAGCSATVTAGSSSAVPGIGNGVSSAQQGQRQVMQKASPLMPQARGSAKPAAVSTTTQVSLLGVPGSAAVRGAASPTGANGSGSPRWSGQRGLLAGIGSAQPQAQAIEAALHQAASANTSRSGAIRS